MVNRLCVLYGKELETVEDSTEDTVIAEKHPYLKVFVLKNTIHLNVWISVRFPEPRATVKKYRQNGGNSAQRRIRVQSCIYQVGTDACNTD